MKISHGLKLILILLFWAITQLMLRQLYTSSIVRSGFNAFRSLRAE